MSIFLTQQESRALRRSLKLLDLNYGRVLLSIVTGGAGLASAIALSGVAAWLIARASSMPSIAALGVAPVMVRLFGISRSLLRYCERLISHDTALRGMTALRTHLYDILAASRTDVVASLRRGDVLARVGTDVDAVGDLVVRAFLPAGVALTVGAVTSLAVAVIYPPAGLILAGCLLLAGLVGPAMTIRAARVAERARQEQERDISSLVLTAIDGGSELSVAGRLPQLLEELGGVEKRLSRTRDRGARPAAVAASIDTLATGIAVIGSILVGLPAVEQGTLEPVFLAVIALLPLSAFEATANLGPASVQLVTSAGAAVRIMELIDRAEASHRDSSSARIGAPSLRHHAVSGNTPTLRTHDLTVGWPGGPSVVKDINLEVTPGKRLAIVGPSGIGKTTLLATLAGLIPPHAGAAQLDGVPTWDLERGAVASRVTLTAEDAHVFDTTIMENIRVARGDVTPSEAHDLLARAGLAELVEQLPLGLDTPVGSDATTLSGGERRRLLLARALATPAPLMLLDEPAEHLDPATADQLVHDLLCADPTRGIVLVTHRLSALSAADEVLVLDAGDDGTAHVRIRGSHAQLLEHDKAYRWLVQREGSVA